MTPVEIALLLALAGLIYQEFSWRDRARRLEADYEKRLAAEVAMAYEASRTAGDGPVRAFTFRAEKEEPHGLFREVTRHLFLAVAMDADEVRYAAGDLSEIERFQIPPEMRRAILEFMAPARAHAAVGG